jgi:Ca-activated chloride channel family protein
MRRSALRIALLLAVATASVGAWPQGPSDFRSGIELINVAAWVTDRSGRFVSGLRKEDFTIFEDGEEQEVAYFSNERVPVSLGLVLDTSGSMTPDKMSAARSAIDRFVHDLLGPDDELFFLEFANRPHLLQEWTTDRRAISSAVARVRPAGGTAMYDAVADAVPMASIGKHPKKAILVISDGNDTNSRVAVGELRQIIRESEVLVYALGVDGTAVLSRTQPRVRTPFPGPPPFPIPGRRPQRPTPPIVIGRGARVQPGERVDAEALRRMTDDSGGRTEIVRGFGDLSSATARIADELSKQYYLGYASPGKRDGRWHEIRVEAKGRGLTVRARRGYVAS